MNKAASLQTISLATMAASSSWISNIGRVAHLIRCGTIHMAKDAGHTDAVGGNRTFSGQGLS